MKKRLFCILLAVSMVGSSMAAYAAEQEEPFVTQMPAWEGLANGSEAEDEEQEQEGENPDVEVTPGMIPKEEQGISPQETAVPEETENPEAAVTPETTPDEVPEETATPDIISTQTPAPAEMPEMTPCVEPTELPDESPTLEISATPSMTPFFDEAIMSIAEGDELVGASTGWVDGWIGQNDETIEVTLGGGGDDKGEANPGGISGAGIGKNVTLNLKDYTLVVNKSDFECLGKLVVEGNSVVNLKDEFKSDAEVDFNLNGSILVKENASLTIVGNINFYGTAVLEKGATLMIQKTENPQYDPTNSGNGCESIGGDASFDDAESGAGKILGEGTVIVTGNYCGIASDVTEEKYENAYNVVNLIVNRGITLKIMGNLTADKKRRAWHLKGEGDLIIERDRLDPAPEIWTLCDDIAVTIPGDYHFDEYRDFIVKTGAVLAIKKDLIQDGGNLILNGGTVRVEGNYKLSGGWLDMPTSNSEDEVWSNTLIVDGDFVNGKDNHCANGTIQVGGNIDLGISTFNGGEGFKVVLTGEGTHKISSGSSGSTLNLAVDNNPKVDLGGSVMNLTLATDGTIIPTNGPLALVGNLKLNGHSVKIQGDADITGQIMPEGDNVCLEVADTLVMNGSLNLKGNKMKISGNVEAAGRVEVGGSDGILEVTGNYTQLSNDLKLNGGKVVVGGDFQIRGKDENGNYCTGDGGLIMNDSRDSLTIGGNLYMESVNASRYTYVGTMTVKGNIEQKDVGEKSRFYGGKGFTLVLAGDKSQTVSLESRDSVLNNLELQNENVTVKGYLHAQLVSNGSINLPSDGTLEIIRLNLQNNRLVIKGDESSIVKASGGVDLGGLNGYLEIQGNYMQSSGSLRIGDGEMKVGGDLLLLDRDDNNNDITGDGRLAMAEEEGRLTVNGDLIIQSTQNSNLSKGTIILSGDLIQKKGEDGSGTGSIDASVSHKVVLVGDKTQNIELESEDSKLGTLQLTKDPSDYGFDPSDVSIKVTTGAEPTPRPTSSPAPTSKPSASPQPSLAPMPTQNPSGFPFADVHKDDWCYESVKYVYENNIMNGFGVTTQFAPSELMNRGMFATVLYRMAGEPPVAFENRFPDVKDGIYYSKAVIWAYNEGIVDGLGDGRLFGPEDHITREQMAKMLREYGRDQGYAVVETDDLSGFPDNAEVSGWAVDYMSWAVGSGMINGKAVGDKNYLEPLGNASRAECAAMLARFMKKYAS